MLVVFSSGFGNISKYVERYVSNTMPTPSTGTPLLFKHKFYTDLKQLQDRLDCYPDLEFDQIACLQAHLHAAITGPEEDQFTYATRVERYLLSLEELDRALIDYSTVFLVLRTPRLIAPLRSRYPTLVSIHVDHDATLLQDWYSTNGLTQLAGDASPTDDNATSPDLIASGQPSKPYGVEDRCARAHNSYLLEPDLYDYVLFNDTKYEIIEKQLDSILGKAYPQLTGYLHCSEQEIVRLPRSIQGYADTLRRKLLENQYDLNVFIMIKYRDSNLALRDQISRLIREYGYNPVLANAWSLTWETTNPIACLMCCKYGIAVFDEAEKDNAYSPNVAYELGILHYLHRDCLILVHKKLPEKPFDIVHYLCTSYDGSTVKRTRDDGTDFQVPLIQVEIENWLRQTCPKKPPIVETII
jgi:hypothetical protein